LGSRRFRFRGHFGPVPALRRRGGARPLAVFHTAVLAYVSPAAARANFAREVGSRCDYWIANEAPGLFPDIARQAAAPGRRGSFLLSRNGAPVEWTDPRGAWLRWI
jgi:hypothetical protein